MPDWGYTTIGAREPVGPSETQLAAFLLDLRRHAIIDERYTLISSPDGEISRSGHYPGFPWPPRDLQQDPWDHLIAGPKLAAGAVIARWFDVVDDSCDQLVSHPATVHYDGPDLDRLLWALADAAVGTADVFMLACPGAAVDYRGKFDIADAVGVTALATPARYQVFNGGWDKYREKPPLRPWDEDPEAEAEAEDPETVPEHVVQWSFNAWSRNGRGGSCDYYIAPLFEVLHRHLGPDLMTAFEYI